MTRVDDILLDVSPTNGRPQRVVVAIAGPVEHRDHFDTDSSISRGRFIRDLASKLGVEAAELASLDGRLVAAANEADAAAEARRAEHAVEPGDDTPRKSQATSLVELLDQSRAELFHDAGGETYATIRVETHHETHRTSAKALRTWLARTYYQHAGTAPGAQAIADALTVLGGRALFDGPEHPVYVRLADHDGRIYLDLADAQWRAVEIDARGWRIVSAPPVRFRRAKAMLPLPEPERGGSVADLRQFINAADDHWPLIVAWLVAALRPVGPYPVLCLHAEHGSGKSTTAQMLRALTDPNTADLRSEPREPRDLMIAATNGWVIALDNLSYLPPWLSDCLCRLSTGGGFSTRTLYENDEETIFAAMRPVLLTGIEELPTRGDLVDRALIVTVPKIAPQDRKTEKRLWREFDQARPRLLGAMLTAVSAALKNLASLELPALPRMADFATWVVAAEPSLGLAAGEFLSCYTQNQDSANDLALESSPVAPLVRELAESCPLWTGTSGELLAELDGRIDDRTRKQRSWPSTARGLSGIMRRLGPNLRAVGIDVEFGRSNKRRYITITRTRPESTVTCVTTVTDPGFSDAAGDANGVPGDTNDPFGDANELLNDAGDAGDGRAPALF